METMDMEELPAPVAVIGAQFCCPDPLDLVFARKAIDSEEYAANLASGELVFRTTARSGLHHLRMLLDANGKILACFKDKVFSLHDHRTVYAGMQPELNESNKLFTVRSSSIFQFYTSLNVFLPGNTELKIPDYTVKGRFRKKEYTIFDSWHRRLAKVKRKADSERINTYYISVRSGADSAFIVALMLIVDQRHKTYLTTG